MGLDIGFHRETDWAPRPGWKFGSALASYVEGEQDYLALTAIRECYAAFTADVENVEHIERAKMFVEWCERYWDEGRIEPETHVPVVFDS